MGKHVTAVAAALVANADYPARVPTKKFLKGCRMAKSAKRGMTKRKTAAQSKRARSIETTTRSPSGPSPSVFVRGGPELSETLKKLAKAHDMTIGGFVVQLVEQFSRMGTADQRKLLTSPSSNPLTGLADIVLGFAGASHPFSAQQWLRALAQFVELRRSISNVDDSVPSKTSFENLVSYRLCYVCHELGRQYRQSGISMYKVNDEKDTSWMIKYDLADALLKYSIDEYRRLRLRDDQSSFFLGPIISRYNEAAAISFRATLCVEKYMLSMRRDRALSLINESTDTHYLSLADAFMNEHCNNDSTFRVEVESMLQAAVDKLREIAARVIDHGTYHNTFINQGTYLQVVDSFKTDPDFLLIRKLNHTEPLAKCFEEQGQLQWPDRTGVISIRNEEEWVRDVIGELKDGLLR